MIPRVARCTATPSRAALYGHGLLGDADEINAGNVQACRNEHDFVFCATRWSGMSDEDIPNAVAILRRPLAASRRSPTASSRASLNLLYLGRLLIHPQGLRANPAFQDGGRS